MVTQLIHRKCPFCKSDRPGVPLEVSYETYGLLNPTYIQTKADHLRKLDSQVNPAVCGTCGFLYVPQVPGPELCRLIYEEIVDWQMSLTKTTTPSKLEARQYICDTVERMRQNVGVAQPSILDLGCGWGDLLADFLARGWQAVGVELSARRRNHAASLGVTIFETLGQAKKHGPFDAVLAVQYLEHDPYFPKTVGRLHDMLKPDGIAYFSVPSSETLFIYDNSGVPHLPPKPSPDINPFEHVNYFRPKDLVRVLHGTGFEVFDPNTFSPVKKLDGTYCVARKAKGV